jgi:hypothetical protein
MKSLLQLILFFSIGADIDYNADLLEQNDVFFIDEQVNETDDILYRKDSYSVSFH